MGWRPLAARPNGRPRGHSDPDSWIEARGHLYEHGRSEQVTRARAALRCECVLAQTPLRSSAGTKRWHQRRSSPSARAGAPEAYHARAGTLTA
eukprot:11539135-Alexandrium_andersonii.AAC.1